MPTFRARRNANQGQSLRRANAVGAELVKDGVSQNLIFIQAFGDDAAAGADRARCARAAEPPRRDHS